MTLLAAVAGPAAVGAPAPAGATHIGYTDMFVTNTEIVPSNYVSLAGPIDAWRVDGNVLQAVRIAGTGIELLDPNALINNVGNQLLGLCFLPEQTINSAFYSGFIINEAPIIELNLGSALNILKVRINVPLDTLQIVDNVGNVLANLDLLKNIQFNQWTCINLLVLADLNQILVILGNTLDSVGHVVDGVTQVAQLNAGAPLPKGTFGLFQAPGNTARVLFRDVHLQATPDVPLELQTFAGPSDGQITLKWDAPEANGGSYVTAYNIYRGLNPDFSEMTLVATLDGGYETEFTDQPYSGLIPTSQQYYYRITAVNMVGEGPLALAACGIPYPMGLLLLENSGLGCGSHGLIEAPTLNPFLP